MILNSVYSEENGQHQLSFSVQQLTTPNFLQVINDSDKQTIIRVVTFDVKGNELNNLSIEKVVELMYEARGNSIRTNSIHVVIHEETEKISLFSTSKLDKNAVSVFDFQNVRLTEDYKPYKSDLEYPLLNYFRKLLDQVNVY